MNRYEGYQDVDSYWYGEVPSYWKKTKNKYVFCQDKHVVGEDWEKFTLLTMGKSGVKPRDMDGGGKFPESFENYQTVEPDQLIFCLFDLDETPRTIGMSKDNGMITSAYDVFSTTEGNDPQFWTYFYQMIDDHKGLRPFYTGLRKVVRFETFMGIEVFSPPFDEQKLIARYLDKKTEQIDQLVEKIQKKIGLLKEQRTSLINQCVTKGLPAAGRSNSNVEMKDSGVEWIGEIPKHWEHLPIKRILLNSKDSMRTGPFGSELKSTDFVDEGFKVYNQRTVYDDEYFSGDLFIDETKFQSLSGFVVKEGDLLITTRGTIGRISIVPEGIDLGVIHPCLIRFRTNDDMIVKSYLVKYINESSHFITNVLFESNSTTIEVIYSDTLKNVYIPVPPLIEQKQILNYLEQQVSQIDRLILNENNRINLLKEYRQSLISSVVTGKVRVTPACRTGREDMI